MMLLKIFPFLIVSLLFFSCATKESAVTLPEKVEVTPDHFRLKDSIKVISTKLNGWREADEFYRMNIAPVWNDELVNFSIFMLFSPRSKFIEEANVETLEFYLNEATKPAFNLNLRLIVQMLEKIDTHWSNHKKSDYANAMYDKNVKYWEENFAGQTVYIEKNQEALIYLASIQK